MTITHHLIELLFFSAKFLIAIILLLFFLIGIISIVVRGKEKSIDKFKIKHLNKKFDHIKDQFNAEILPTSDYKKILKLNKKNLKLNKKNPPKRERVFILDFQGDVKGSAVNHLREEVTAILNIATPQDKVLVKIESGGGLVHAYGLAAAQLARIRDKKIPLIASIDKVAASGGYLMACVANHIIAAPFSVIGSIGVLVQIPNFHRFLKEKNIDFEQITAGNYKRTLTLFGENTESAREKMREELEIVHRQFKDLVTYYRPQVDIVKVATGEHWLALEAQKLNLIDTLQTSDDWILSNAQIADLYTIKYHAHQTLTEKLFANVKLMKSHLLTDLNKLWI